MSIAIAIEYRGARIILIIYGIARIESGNKTKMNEIESEKEVSDCKARNGVSLPWPVLGAWIYQCYSPPSPCPPVI